MLEQIVEPLLIWYEKNVEAYYGEMNHSLTMCGFQRLCFSKPE